VRGGILSEGDKLPHDLGAGEETPIGGIFAKFSGGGGLSDAGGGGVFWGEWGGCFVGASLLWVLGGGVLLGGCGGGTTRFTASGRQPPSAADS